MLHQAAYNNAPLEFIQMLITCGAWREPVSLSGSSCCYVVTITAGTLKSDRRDGNLTAKDVASRQGNQTIVPILEPKVHHPIAAATLEKLESNLHGLMMRLAGTYVSQASMNILVSY